MDPSNSDSDPNQNQQTPQTGTIVSTPSNPQSIITPHDTHADRKKKKIILGVSILLVLIIGGLGIAFALNKNSKPEPVQQNLTPAQATKPLEKAADTTSPELAKFIKPTTGETWLAAPKPIAKLGYYADIESEADYYEVGKHGSNTIIMGIVNLVDEDTSLFEKAPDGTVTFIGHPDNIFTYPEHYDDDFASFYVPSVKINTTISYDSLSIPRSLSLDNGYSVSKNSYGSLGRRLSNEDSLTADQKPKRETIKELGGSKLVRVERPYTDTGLTSIGYEIITPLQTDIGLEYSPVSTNGTDYAWSLGASAATGSYKAITRGCGGVTTSVTKADKLTDSDTVQAGTLKDGSPVYQFKDANYSIVNKAYDEFKEFDSYDPNSANAKLTKQDFISQHALVLYKDKTGQWLVYINENLAPSAGCAKPVVYLYPTTPTTVKVKVGADVKVSEPLYDSAKGWTALAQPNGRLTVAGKNYDSLFWEGPGYGAYPSITSGTVVARSQSVATIKSQLSAQGLNAKESQDFLDYWQDKIPNKPYVRLTWFNTAQLNQLAPLSVSPKPATTIRVFLDMSGLDKPITMKPQTFTAPQRNGFTLVEWGGLAANKLY